MTSLLPFQTAAFLGSFLAFSIELIAARLLLPFHGGSAQVWSTAVMFYTATLYLGYRYARRALAGASYGRAHLAFLGAPLLLFPIRLGAPGGGPPAWEVVKALALSVGPAFFALSTTVPVLQNWLGRSGRELEDKEGYRLYAASNSGALAALLGYALLAEPLIPVSGQLRLWQAGYVFFIIIHLACLPSPGVLGEGVPPPPTAGSGLPARPGAAGQERAAAIEPRLTARWLALSAGTAAAMLAATNQLAFDFGSLPLIWILPLGIYLATFVANFKKNPWFPSGLHWCLLAFLGIVMIPVMAAVLADHLIARGMDLLVKVAVLAGVAFQLSALFAVCMVGHRALAASRPEEASAPAFYSTLGLGGWLGAALIGVLAPILGRRAGGLWLDWGLALGLSMGGLILRDWDEWAAWGRRFKLRWLIFPATLAAFIMIMRPPGPVIETLRNFYGVYRVARQEMLIKLYHGNTVHGLQWENPARQGEPLAYYHRDSPLGLVFAIFGPKAKTVGVVGLGAGAIAAFGRPGQEITFYELDPDMEGLARRHFTYLKDSKARVRVVPGDARRTLSADSGALYDLLILDAFSSDAVPVHLLTREAFALYLKRLRPKGVIVCHISSRFVNLGSVLAAAALDLGLPAAGMKVPRGHTLPSGRLPSSWFAISRDPLNIAALKVNGWKEPSAKTALKKVWTDDHASVLPVLNF